MDPGGTADGVVDEKQDFSRLSAPNLAEDVRGLRPMRRFARGWERPRRSALWHTSISLS